MHTPAAALTWEIWRRHGKRLMTIVFLILGFAMFYTRLCTLIGLKLDSPNVLDNILESVPMYGERPDVFGLVAMIGLSCAPFACMAISILCIIWMFTFTDQNPKAPFRFPSRFFTLPISTRFLVSWLMVVGSACLILVYLGWTRLVHLPHIEVFDRLSDGLSWVTLLVLSQAIIWSLNAFPFATTLLLAALGLCFFVRPDFQWSHPIAEHRTAFLLSLMAAGVSMALVGFDKVRHGSWQRWIWKWQMPFASKTLLKDPKMFSSPAQAQLWFEWRRQARTLFYCVCILSGVPVLLLATELILHPGPSSGNTTHGLIVFLLAVPLFIHSLQGISHERTMSQFKAIRPINNGTIVVAQWKATALSAVLSWVITLLLIGLVIWLGDLTTVKAVLHSIPNYPQLIEPLIPVILPVLIFWTWSFAVDNAWVGATFGTWIYRVYAAVCILVVACIAFLAITRTHPAFEWVIVQILPIIFAFLIILKFALAQWAFRVAIKKQVMDRSTAVGLIFTWTTLAVVFLTPTLLILGHEKWILPLSLSIILMIPIARMGFAPLALNLGRHR